MRVISCRTQLEVMHDFQTDKRNTWLTTVIKEDFNFMFFFRPTYCLISMQACNKSLFAFPLSSFCLLVILPWVIWVSGLTLLHSNLRHTRDQAGCGYDRNWVTIWQNKTAFRSSLWVPQSTLKTLSPVTKHVSTFHAFQRRSIERTVPCCSEARAFY